MKHDFSICFQALRFVIGIYLLGKSPLFWAIGRKVPMNLPTEKTAVGRFNLFGAIMLIY